MLFLRAFVVRLNSTVIPLRFLKTQNSAMEPRDSLGWCVDGFARGRRGEPALVLRLLNGDCERRARSLSTEGLRVTMQGGITNRWTRAESARLSSTTCP